MLSVGCCLNQDQRDKLAKKLGRVLSEEVWTYSVTGHRILICPEPVQTTYKGLIHKPRSAQEREALEVGAGWIISVGPMAGSGDEWFPGGLRCEQPHELLGLKVLFQSHSGKVIKTSDEDTEFGGQFSLLVMTTRDVLMVGWEPL